MYYVLLWTDDKDDSGVPNTMDPQYTISAAVSAVSGLVCIVMRGALPLTYTHKRCQDVGEY